jgi:hypothetical protein
VLFSPTSKRLSLKITITEENPPTLLVAVLGGGWRPSASEIVFTDTHHWGADLSDECARLVEQFLAWTRDRSFQIEDSESVGP